MGETPNSERIDWASVDWKVVTPQVLLYATYLMRRLVWRGRPYISDEVALEPTDFVYTAIEKTLSGKRHWNSKEYSLVQHLKAVVRSDINHHVSSLDNSMIVSNEYQSNQNLSDDLSPEDVSTQDSEVSALLNYLEISDEKLAVLAKSILFDGLASNIEIANSMSIEVSDVVNLKKRLERSVKNFLEGTYGEKRND